MSTSHGRGGRLGVTGHREGITREVRARDRRTLRRSSPRFARTSPATSTCSRPQRWRDPGCNKVRCELRYLRPRRRRSVPLVDRVGRRAGLTCSSDTARAETCVSRITYARTADTHVAQHLLGHASHRDYAGLPGETDAGRARGRGGRCELRHTNKRSRGAGNGRKDRSRRRPESNRCRRLCRPLRSHSATSPGGSSVAVR